MFGFTAQHAASSLPTHSNGCQLVQFVELYGGYQWTMAYCTHPGQQIHTSAKIELVYIHRSYIYRSVKHNKIIY